MEETVVIQEDFERIFDIEFQAELDVEQERIENERDFIAAQLDRQAEKPAISPPDAAAKLLDLIAGVAGMNIDSVIDSNALQTGANVWIAGPAGSGKTTAAENAAKALGLPFYFNGAIDTEYKLTGFIDAQGRIVSTAFREAFVNGGVYLFDECDASLAPATLAFNAALSNGMADFPGGIERKHKDFFCIAAANTWGLGASIEYVGRNKLDAAFLDRFVRINWEYDETLEKETSGNHEWCDYVRGMREKAKSKGLKVVISPRATYFGARLLNAGMDWDKAVELTIKNGLTNEQWKGLTR